MKEEQSIFELSTSKYFIVYIIMMGLWMLTIGIAFFEKDIQNYFNNTQVITESTTRLAVVHYIDNLQPSGFINS